MTDSTNLQMPYIAASQAQKHVTHNEAIRLLDGLVQMSVIDRDLTAPPGAPADGDRYIVAAGATGAWAGWDSNIAYYVDGVWMRLIQRTGWLAWIADEAQYALWDGAWVTVLGDVTQADLAAGLYILRAPVGSVGAPSFSFAGDPDTGFYQPAADQIGFGTGGVQRVLLTTSALTSAVAIRGTAGTAALPSFSFASDVNTGFYNPAADQIGFATGGVQRVLLSSAALQIDVPLEVTEIKQKGTGIHLSSTLFTTGGDGAISIYRSDPSSGSLRTATISSVASDVITLTATEAWKFFDQSRMTGVSMVRIWNTTKVPAESAWVLARPTSSTLQVQNAADIAGWLATETIQVGDPTGSGMGGNVIALDISPMLIALYGEAFRQTGIEVKAALVGATGDLIALTPSGVTGSFITAALHGTGDGTTMVASTELSPISNSNLVGIKETIAASATVRLVSVIAVYR